MLNRHPLQGKQFKRMLSISCQKCSVAAETPMPVPRKDGEAKIYSERITNIVSEISKLTLAEVSDLNNLLKVWKHVVEFFIKMKLCFIHFKQCILIISSCLIYSWH